jgi:hypothetical protein
MNTDNPSLRRVRQLRGYGALVVAAALVVSLRWAPVAGSSSVVVSVVVALICLFGGVQLWLAHRTPPTVRVSSRYSDPNRLPLQQRVRYFRVQLLVSFVLFPILSAWTAYDLNRLESGSVASVRVWFPVSFVYEHLGYWPAVLAWPLSGAAICMVWFFKLKELTRIDGSA